MLLIPRLLALTNQLTLFFFAVPPEPKSTLEPEAGGLSRGAIITIVVSVVGVLIVALTALAALALRCNCKCRSVLRSA